jgi:hypothetical protein
VANKLFCTFAKEDNIDSILDDIVDSYSILYNKIFIFTVVSKPGEYILTYNVDLKNTKPELLGNTILVHRKKESNTLYTINALNTLIRTLNNGIQDSNFRVDWSEYKNCLLLTNNNDLKTTYLKIDEIIYLD